MTDTEDGDMVVDQHVFQSSGFITDKDQAESLLEFYTKCNKQLDMKALYRHEQVAAHEERLVAVKDLHVYKCQLANESSSRGSSSGRGQGGPQSGRGNDKSSAQGGASDARSARSMGMKAKANKPKKDAASLLSGGRDARSQTQREKRRDSANEEKIQSLMAEIAEVRAQLAAQQGAGAAPVKTDPESGIHIEVD